MSESIIAVGDIDEGKTEFWHKKERDRAHIKTTQQYKRGKLETTKFDAISNAATED